MAAKRRDSRSTSHGSRSPDEDQSDKAIRKWLSSHVEVGAIVAVANNQDGSLHYERGVVLSVRPKNFGESGPTFDYAGRNWRERDDGLRIVIPTEAVLEACDAAKSKS